MSNEQAAKKFQVGEAVVLVGHGHGFRSEERRAEHTTVESVGRQWVKVGARRNDRFDAITGMVDGRGYSGRSRIVRPDDFAAEETEREAREKLDALGITVDTRRAPKAFTHKAVWEALSKLSAETVAKRLKEGMEQS